jgi:hypothetical protein
VLVVDFFSVVVEVDGVAVALDWSFAFAVAGFALESVVAGTVDVSAGGSVVVVVVADAVLFASLSPPHAASAKVATAIRAICFIVPPFFVSKTDRNTVSIARSQILVNHRLRKEAPADGIADVATYMLTIFPCRIKRIVEPMLAESAAEAEWMKR